MVELPQYVRRVTARGQTFYYFHKGRGTAAEWPAIALPAPFEPEFQHRLDICNAMALGDSGFSIADVALPGHRDAAFWKAADKAFAIKDAADHQEKRTFKALVTLFEKSAAFNELADSTRRGYEHYGELVTNAWGDDLPAELTTVDAQQAIDSMADTPAAARGFRAYLSRLLAFGIPRGYCTINVAEFSEKVGESEPWPSWPEWAFEMFFEKAPPHIALPHISALFTGQRQVDVLAMPRPRLSEPTIPVRAQKTGEIVWIPIHSEYRQWIEATPASDHVQLHIGVGSPGQMPAAYTTSGYRAVLNKWMKTIELTPEETLYDRFKRNRIVFHGLRKNAVVMLLEAGCTETMVGSIVNMSEQMVRHYGRDVRVRELARQGMKLLERRWKELRPTGLPKVIPHRKA